MPTREAAPRHEQAPSHSFVQELSPDRETSIELPDYDDEQPHQVATAYLAPSMKDERGYGAALQFIDLSNVPLHRSRDGDIYRKFHGQRINATADMLVIDPDQLDWEQGTGFKSLQPGNTLTFGRAHHTDRFGGQDATVSRDHLNVTLAEDGKTLVFHDLGSSNGTILETTDDMRGVSRPIETDEPPVSSSYEQSPSPERAFRTLPDHARIVSPEEVATSFEGIADDPRQPEITRNFIQSERFRPRIGIEEDGRQFAFSAISEAADGRKYSVGYTTVDGQMTPRMFYKSNSDGGWRVASYVEPNGRFNKGDTDLHLERFDIHDEYGQYTQVSKPVESIAAMLESMESTEEFTGQPGFKTTYLLQQFRDNPPTRTLQDEARIHVAKGRFMGSFVPGHGYIGPAEVLDRVQLPAGFEPDFRDDPVRSFQMEHSALGAVDVDVYGAQFEGRDIEWEVARDRQRDTAWVDRVRFADGHMTSYGTEQDVIIAGVVNVKPMEYAASLHVPQRERGESLGQGYQSLKPTLDRMPWIRRFRAARTARRRH